MTTSRRNKTRFAVLGMLSIQPKTGYDIKKDIETLLPTVWSESYGQIYKVLAQLETEKLVTRKHIEQKGRPNKVRYSITKRGQKELIAYLHTPPDKIVIRDETMLKLFMGFNVEPIYNIEVLNNEIARIQRCLDEIPQKKAAMKPLPLPRQNTMFQLMGELGVEYFQMKKRWCRKAIRILQEGAEKHSTKEPS